MRLFIVATVLSLFAFDTFAGWFGLGGTSWKEEALLHDGNKLIVERSVTRGGPHEIGQLGSYTKQTLKFVHPGSGKFVTWEDNATPDLRTSNFLPMTIDVYPDAIYIVVTPMGCLSYNKWGRPNPPYVVFRYRDKEWERIPLRELPQETKALNLIASSPDTEVERLGKRLVDAESIKRINAEFRQPEYQTILRSAVENVGQGCRAEFSNGKGTWLSSDWFSERKDMAACIRVCRLNEFSDSTCPCSQFFK